MGLFWYTWFARANTELGTSDVPRFGRFLMMVGANSDSSVVVLPVKRLLS